MLINNQKEKSWTTSNTRKETLERWENEKAQFIRYIDENGFPSKKEWDIYALKNGYLISGTLKQRIGSWSDIALFFNQPNHAKIKIKYSNEDLIEYLQQTYQSNKYEYFTIQYYKQWAVGKNVPTHNQISTQLARGLWKTALKNAGIERKRKGNIN